jgi:hypothetical protein
MFALRKHQCRSKHRMIQVFKLVSTQIADSTCNHHFRHHRGGCLLRRSLSIASKAPLSIRRHCHSRTRTWQIQICDRTRTWQIQICNVRERAGSHHGPNQGESTWRAHHCQLSCACRRSSKGMSRCIRPTHNHSNLRKVKKKCVLNCSKELKTASL